MNKYLIWTLFKVQQAINSFSVYKIMWCEILKIFWHGFPVLKKYYIWLRGFCIYPGLINFILLKFGSGLGTFQLSYKGHPSWAISSYLKSGIMPENFNPWYTLNLPQVAKDSKSKVFGCSLLIWQKDDTVFSAYHLIFRSYLSHFHNWINRHVGGTMRFSEWLMRWHQVPHCCYCMFLQRAYWL